MSDFLNSRCPFGSFGVDWNIRHCADFSGVTGKIVIPDSLIEFREFGWNEKKKRISFLTATNSGCRKEFQSVVFSMDKYQIDKWNQIFIEANPHLKYDTPSSPGGVKFYDFADRDSDDKNGFTFWNKSKETLADIGNALPETVKSLFWIALIGGGFYLLSDNSKKHSKS